MAPFLARNFHFLNFQYRWRHIRAQFRWRHPRIVPCLRKFYQRDLKMQLFCFVTNQSIFGLNFDFWRSFLFLSKISIFDHNFDFYDSWLKSSFDESFYFWPIFFSFNIKSFVKSQNFHLQKSNSSSKIKSFVKNQIFCQKSIFLSKIKSFVKNQNFRQKSIFSSKLKMFENGEPKIESFVKNENFRQKFDESFRKKYNFSSKLEFLDKILKFHQKLNT